jgi:tripartite-type tricarboxylate transporter receptor subunit TctC
MIMKSIARVLCFLGLLVATMALQAQEWPSKPIKIVVPYAAGGLTDTIGRTLADGLSKSLGVSAIVDNRPGAGSIIGTDYVAKAAPDGYTMLVGAGPIATAEFLYPKLPYNPRVDLVPAGLVARGGLLLVASSNPTNASTLPALLQQLKAKPGVFSIASFGSGTLSHMMIAQLESDAGVSLNHVPYRGSAPALQDVAGGQVDLMFDNVATSLPLITGGRLKAIAYSGAERSPQLPNVPTFKESGLQRSVAYNFYGIYLPKATSPEIVAKVNAQIVRIFSNPSTVARYAELGVELVPRSGLQLEKILGDERIRWGPIIKAKGITAD